MGLFLHDSLYEETTCKRHSIYLPLQAGTTVCPYSAQWSASLCRTAAGMPCPPCTADGAELESLPWLGNCSGIFIHVFPHCALCVFHMYLSTQPVCMHTCPHTQTHTHIHTHTHTLTHIHTHSLTHIHSHTHSVGGYDGQSFLDTVECYDPSNKQWSRLQPMTCRRSEQYLLAN